VSEFLDMKGYGAYVWSAYAISIGILSINIWIARRQIRSARAEARRRLATQESLP
jgi:heme exporter protein D